MIEFIDSWLLTICNHWVAHSAKSFYQALSLSNEPAWIIAACTIVALWFVGDRKEQNATAPTNQLDASASQLDSQRRVLLLFASLVIGFLLAQMVRHGFTRIRPMLSVPIDAPIDPGVWKGIREVFKKQGGSFPSDHAAMFAVVTLGVFLVNRWAGYLALAVNLYFSALRVGLGFHWPTDIIVGQLIGLMVALVLLKFKPRLHFVLDPVLAYVERSPHIAYPILFLIMWDFTRKFETLFHALSKVGIILVH